MTRELVTARSRTGMVSAPESRAAEAGRAVLAEGGNALEAAVATGAAIAASYPHMNGLGGDAFWLVHLPGRDAPVAIRGCGPAGAKATPGWYAERGLTYVPPRGPAAANTVAGTVAAWQAALDLAAECGGTMPLARLLAPAIALAEGAPAAASFSRMAAACAGELCAVPGFADAFLPGGRAPRAGEIFRQPALAETLRRLARAGLDDFYRGRLAGEIAAELASRGTPVAAADLAAFRAALVEPLRLDVSRGTLYNHPPPTQGLTSLMILGLVDRLAPPAAEGFDFVHAIVEASKQAYGVRDAVIADPACMTADARDYLAPAALDAMAARIDAQNAGPWGVPAAAGDTVWFGAADRAGIVVSVIQSLYWEFGSALVLPGTGLLWQNRGTAFEVAARGLRAIAPGRLPFHTLNPALARLKDGRVMAYGTMGGDGQPQFQAAIFARYAMFGRDLQDSVAAPRWLVGRTWGADSAALRVENRFDRATLAALAAAGHHVETVGPYAEFMGHAGAVVHHPDGVMEGATDPRSDGAALGV